MSVLVNSSTAEELSCLTSLFTELSHIAALSFQRVCVNMV